MRPTEQPTTPQQCPPSLDEVATFIRALNSVSKSPDWNTTASRTALMGIRIGKGVGNSIQDLHLSLYGFKLGMLIRKAEMTTRKEVAQWIRIDLGAKGALNRG